MRHQYDFCGHIRRPRLRETVRPRRATKCSLRRRTGHIRPCMLRRLVKMREWMPHRAFIWMTRHIVVPVPYADVDVTPLATSSPRTQNCWRIARPVPPADPSRPVFIATSADSRCLHPRKRKASPDRVGTHGKRAESLKTTAFGATNGRGVLDDWRSCF